MSNCSGTTNPQIRRLPTVFYGQPRGGTTTHKIHDTKSTGEEIRDVQAKLANLKGEWAIVKEQWAGLNGQWVLLKWAIGGVTTLVLGRILFDINVMMKVTALDDQVAAINEQLVAQNVDI
ncbi:uncharacterized protein DFL_009179 [Arthrobotrys flagrans]|uniref:Uncharacterized protein n=1 Tax=Arthrobotrys flagrans TaxID=97331 RepID=A0A436ZRA0_ARTFL|nr:hypothetical protein DFL_009179 [Arthrobotrys flagrans]